MKGIILSIIAAFFLIITHGQGISGQWNGVLKTQGLSLRIVFNISKTDSGYSSTMDSPDQGARGIPMSTTSFEHQVVKLQLPLASIEFVGKLETENRIEGTFKQAGQSFPLSLSKTTVAKEVKPETQEPIAPYPYYTEDVKFINKIANITLAGTLSLPKSEGIYPVVILISGSGPQNRDEEILGHKPFLVLADHLTKKGIGVLRFDDRGTGSSTGDFKRATSADFAMDVEAAVDYLLTRKDVDTKNIGLAGHSEGGIIAPMVAASNKNIAYIVLMAGTGVPGGQLLLMQQQLIGKASGISDAQLEKSGTINKAAFELVAKATNYDTMKIDLDKLLRQALDSMPETERPSDSAMNDFVRQSIEQLTSAWMIYFIKHDPSLILQQVHCPVLAINGEKDLQVPATANLEAIQKALDIAGNKQVTIKKLPGLNHLFQECETGSPDEYAKIVQTFSPTALGIISEWILQQIK